VKYTQFLGLFSDAVLILRGR